MTLAWKQGRRDTAFGTPEISGAPLPGPNPNSADERHEEEPVEEHAESTQPTVDQITALQAQNPGKLYCPVCGTIAESFLPAGRVVKRPNGRCPECGSAERHRLIWAHLFDQVWPRLPDRKKDILHVAPEGFFVSQLKGRPDVNYVSGDLMMSGSMAKLDLTDIRFWDEQFDLIICSHVLEHIPDDLLAMREMRRVLRPGGFLQIMVPIHGDTTYEDPSITSPEDRLKHFGQDDHVRKYGADIRGRLEASGFSVRFWPADDKSLPAFANFIAARGRNVIECRK